jgi:prefoldin subunit 5
LEALAKNNEHVNGEIADLQKTIERLQNTKRDKENFEKASDF